MASQIAANDKIRIATIGIGEMGTGDTKSALAVPPQENPFLSLRV